MFTALSEQLTAVLKRLTERGVLSEADVTEALREIRGHLLEADVGFEVTRAFVERVRERAVGALQVEAVRPGQQVAKLVHDEIARMLGAEVGPDGRLVGPQGAAPLQFNSVGPTLLLLVGLQGSGKTTTAAKLARRLKREQKAPCLWRRTCIGRRPGNSSSSSAGKWGCRCFRGRGKREGVGASSSLSGKRCARPSRRAAGRSSWTRPGACRSTSR